MQHTSVTCPDCGARTEIVAGRRDASDFCRACDFPLFWSGSAVTAQASDDEADAAMRRLPGASGKGIAYSVPCPSCGELNLPTAHFCLRCTGSMTPPPPPVPVPLPLPAPVPPPEPVVTVVEPARFPWWWLVLAGLAMTAFVVGIAFVAS